MSTPKVMPFGGPTDYQFDALGIPEADMDQYSPINERTFRASANLQEGHAGRKGIDSSYENYSDPEVNAPRSTLPVIEDAGVKGTAGTRQAGLEKYPHRRH